MKRKVAIFAFIFAVAAVLAMPAFAQDGDAKSNSSIFWGLAIGMGVAAAGCGLAQSNALRGGCDGVARNPGAADTIRLFIFLGLALIEFLALLTFVVCYLVLNAF